MMSSEWAKCIAVHWSVHTDREWLMQPYLRSGALHTPISILLGVLNIPSSMLVNANHSFRNSRTKSSITSSSVHHLAASRDPRTIWIVSLCSAAPHQSILNHEEVNTHIPLKVSTQWIHGTSEPKSLSWTLLITSVITSDDQALELAAPMLVLGGASSPPVTPSHLLTTHTQAYKQHWHTLTHLNPVNMCHIQCGCMEPYIVRGKTRNR